MITHDSSTTVLVNTFDIDDWDDDHDLVDESSCQIMASHATEQAFHSVKGDAVNFQKAQKNFF